MPKGVTNKRKSLLPERNLIKAKAEVKTLQVADMVISANGSKLRFERFAFKSCPSLFHGPRKIDTSKFTDMRRSSFVRQIYSLLSENITSTTASRYETLIKYVRWVDDNDKLNPINGDMFHWDLIDGFMTWCGHQNSKGLLSRPVWGRFRTNISWILKQLNRNQDAKKLPKVTNVLSYTTSHKSLDIEQELKPITKRLFNAYFKLLEHYKSGTTPDRHPLYDKELLEQIAKANGLTGSSKASHFNAFSKAVNTNIGHSNNAIIKVAMMLCYLFTGINTTPLARMRISDVNFKEIQGGKYILDSIKGRANHQEQDNALGFSKHAKNFMESWIHVAKSMSNGDSDSLLFPYYTKNGEIKSYSEIGRSPHQSINTLLVRLGFPKITPSILRKTKMDALFQVSESVYLVSMSANNSIKAISSQYLHGTPGEHQSRLNAAMDAKFSNAKGIDINTAVEEAKYRHSNILDHYEYESLRQGANRTNEARTPLGIRCNDNKQGALKTINRVLECIDVDLDSNEEACTSFLDCFKCEHHSLVSDVTDIWLMMSFEETLQELEITPAINSMPPVKINALLNTIEAILREFREKSPDNYRQASELQKQSSHPLYSSSYSLNDLHEVFS
ncbi:hypothetical protein KIJ96_20325 (plasmid) [Pseudoalteromonas piscicida]|uniref:hypothetical protein n=1 Tax=Pseudoalteromonas piscicida TaxID=43662 RepID=UPI001D09ECF5|nr:hypothetical protein [Pseudoalteromonas piscicida]UDM64322.1 hypothetical protein KIJ96_20325 [Pseudoalteromonas piscicida]